MSLIIYGQSSTGLGGVVRDAMHLQGLSVELVLGNLVLSLNQIIDNKYLNTFCKNIFLSEFHVLYVFSLALPIFSFAIIAIVRTFADDTINVYTLLVSVRRQFFYHNLFVPC